MPEEEQQDYEALYNQTCSEFDDIRRQLESLKDRSRTLVDLLWEKVASTSQGDTIRESFKSLLEETVRAEAKLEQYE